MLRVAHRGFHVSCPENTLEAFEAALPYEPDAVELDVQLTRDGEIVIFHDETLDRMEGRPGWLKDWTLAELRRLPVRIPLLCEYFELIRGARVDTFVEFKNSYVLYPGLEEKTLALAARYGRLKDCVFYSANHYSVLRCRQLCPEVRLCLPFNDWIMECGTYCDRRDVRTAVPYYRSLTEEIMAEFRQNGVRVIPWTVDDRESMLQMAALGVDGLMTNRIDVMNDVFGA